MNLKQMNEQQHVSDVVPPENNLQDQSTTEVPIPVHLSSDIQLTYLAEGGANIVYRIQAASTNILELRNFNSALFPNSNDCPSKHQGVVLRLHKDVPWIPSSLRLYKDYKRLIEPLFEPHQLLSPRLVSVPQNTMTRLNQDLRAAEQATPGVVAVPQSNALPTAITSSSSSTSITPFHRPNTRHGTYLPLTEAVGLLLPDMSSDPARSLLTIEFKPKWLAQSPNVPQHSTRCRTCALRAMRAYDSLDPSVQTERRPQPAQIPHFCPLALVSSDIAAVRHAVTAVLAQRTAEEDRMGVEVHGDESGGGVTRALVEWFLNDPLLRRLRDQQKQHDPHGILATELTAPVSEGLLIATTLRDCSLFLRVKTGGRSGEDRDSDALRTSATVAVVEARLGDLDLKAPSADKVRKWRGVEERLVGEGWYQGRKADGDSERSATCYLERGKGT